jgi:hypothetical protein
VTTKPISLERLLALSALCAVAACQLSLDLDAYAFSALPQGGDMSDTDGGPAEAGSAPTPPGAPPDAADGSEAGGPSGSCGPCSLANAESACADAECVVSNCRLGFRDDNAVASDGCETPDVATAGLLLWLSADRGVTADAEGLLSAWQDQSEAQRPAIPPSAAASPHRVALDAERFVVEFDGNDELVLPGLPAFSSLSFFAVVAAREGPRCPSFLHISNRVNLDTENEIEIGRHEGALYYEVGSATLMASGAFPPEVLQIATVTHTAADATASLYLGGALVARGAVTLPDAVQRTANYIGFNHWDRPIDGTCAPLLGRIGEMLLYARGMSDAERRVIEGYLADKWGLSLAQ